MRCMTKKISTYIKVSYLILKVIKKKMFLIDNILYLF